MAYATPNLDIRPCLVCGLKRVYGRDTRSWIRQSLRQVSDAIPVNFQASRYDEGIVLDGLAARCGDRIAFRGESCDMLGMVRDICRDKLG